MKRFLFVIMLALSLVAVGLPASTRAAEILRFQYKASPGTGAIFDSMDPSGCIGTGVAVSGIHESIKEAGQWERRSWGFVMIRQYDYCTETWLLEAIGRVPIPTSAFQADQQLNTATLNATLEVYDYVSAREVPVAVNVSWTATGDAVRVRERYQYRFGNFLVKGRDSGTFRPAVASGTVSLKTVSDRGSDSPNLTPELSVQGEFWTDNDGDMAISR